MALPEILNYDYHFRWQYDWAKTMLSDASKFNPEYVSILIDIQKLMSESGFEPAHAGVLDRLRAKIAAGCKGQKVTDAGQSILYAVGIPLDDGKKGPIEHVAKMAASTRIRSLPPCLKRQAEYTLGKYEILSACFLSTFFNFHLAFSNKNSFFCDFSKGGSERLRFIKFGTTPSCL